MSFLSPLGNGTGPSLIDIVYGGSMVTLVCWISFGVLGQCVIGVLVLWRNRRGADVCYGLFRIQFVIAMLVFFTNCCAPYGGCCYGRDGRDAMLLWFIHLRLMVWGYFIVYFLIMVGIVWWRYRKPPALGPIGMASLIAMILDVALTMVGIVLILLLH